MTLPLCHLLLPLALAGEISFFSGPAAGPGDVLVTDEFGATAPAAAAGLSDITLLPIEVSGRTRRDAFDPERARRRTDIPGAARLALPGGQGSLYRYRRDGVVGAFFGFFVVDASGRAHNLVQQLGTGPAATDDPFVDRVAVAPEGSAFLLATTPAAGGDAWEVDLAGNVENRTAATPPCDFVGGGLWLGATWGVASGPEGLMRFQRAPGTQVNLVGFPAGTSWFGGEVVPSRTGATIVTSAGPSPSEALLYSITEAGPLVQRSSVPTTFSGAGYLPESTFGPLLAVHDGGAVAWRAIDGVSNEAWVGLGGADVHLSNNVDYLDTMDQAGVLGFQLSGDLVFAIGEEDGFGGLESLDFYAADVTPAGTTVVNLTQSNGSATAPFTKSTINPEEGLFAIPGTSWILFHDSQSSGAGDVLALDTSSGVFTNVIPDVKSLNVTEYSAGWLLLGVERSAGAKPQELWRLAAATLTPSLLGTGPNALEFLRPVLREDGQVALVINLLGAEWLARFDLATGAGGLLLAFPFAYGPALAFSSSGALALTAGVFGFPMWPLTWTDSGAVAQPIAGPVEGFVLPGA